MDSLLKYKLYAMCFLWNFTITTLKYLILQNTYEILSDLPSLFNLVIKCLTYSKILHDRLCSVGQHIYWLLIWCIFFQAQVLPSCRKMIFFCTRSSNFSPAAFILRSAYKPKHQFKITWSSLRKDLFFMLTLNLTWPYRWQVCGIVLINSFYLQNKYVWSSKKEFCW